MRSNWVRNGVIAVSVTAITTLITYLWHQKVKKSQRDPLIVLITGNKNKMQCFKTFIAEDLRQYVIMDAVRDQEEIQEISSIKVLKQKCHDAIMSIDCTKYDIDRTMIVCEDVSLLLREYDDKLPGPLIKWFINKEDTDANKYILKMLQHPTATREATAMCLYACIPLKAIKHRNNKQKIFDGIAIFEGICNGIIKKKEMGKGPGFTAVFKPNGYDLTYAQMTIKQSRPCSMHAKAINKLSSHLQMWISQNF